MSKRALAAGVAFGLVATLAGGQAALAGPGRNTGGEHPGKGRDGAAVKSVEFIGMDPPATPEQKADIYSSAKIKVTYANRRTQILDLAYHQLMATGETVNGKVVGGLYDVNDQPLTDDNGQIASDAPDGNSLIKVPGARGSSRSSNPLSLVTQYEYRSKPPAGSQFTESDYWSRLPATMSVAGIDQDKRTGALKVNDYDNISFAAENGLWVPCAASLTPWNTHLSSEEYEPDAKTREGLPAAADTQDGTDISGFSKAFFGDPATANAYNYGLVPEVRVHRDGSTSVQMHYALGRIARELADVQPDGRTAFMGDDGGFTGMFMFVADRVADLSSGTLYAAKWRQTSPAGTDGGSAKLSWIRLGHGSDREIRSLVEGGITFSDIFEVSNTDPGDPGFTKVHTYAGTEWLKLNPGMEKAAAFLETRRYAALRGATTEFNKFEGVTHNARDKKVYLVMSRVEGGMADGTGDVQLAQNKGGAVYQMDLARGVRDSSGALIRSRYAATGIRALPALLGQYSSTPDLSGNKCDQDHVCGGDNLKYSEGMRTLFIGEDTSYRNNNYVWAYNVDSGKLSRILSVPMGAEATGLQVVDNYNGSAYVMGNFQHPGEFGSSDPDWAQIEPLLESRWNGLLKTTIGYLGTKDGALPGLR
ncbi:MAG: hypothetical protein CVT65_04245 [Actinobacteria bacterium HGW-Actinobacteria-5]|jgi:hypothetical protein|nr:MAG: hypothetical protein CVT65_04245 [Actinobacteria bacterium HGW-Actinobacteria-5]